MQLVHHCSRVAGYMNPDTLWKPSTWSNQYAICNTSLARQKGTHFILLWNRSCQELHIFDPLGKHSMPYRLLAHSYFQTFAKKYRIKLVWPTETKIQPSFDSQLCGYYVIAALYLHAHAKKTFPQVVTFFRRLMKKNHHPDFIASSVVTHFMSHPCFSRGGKKYAKRKPS